MIPIVNYGNHIFELSRFARRRSLRQPQNMAILLPDVSFESNIAASRTPARGAGRF